MLLREHVPAPSFSYASDELPSVSQRIVRAIEKVTGQPRIKDLYQSYAKLGRPPQKFWSDAVRVLRLRLELSRTPGEALPAMGPHVVIANHPFGVVDGIVLCWIVSQVRPDYRIMTHRILHQAPEVRDYVLPVDFSGTKAALLNNIESRRKAREILAAGVSLTHDMSGPCDTRSVRFWNRSRQGGEDEADSGVARSTTDEVRADPESVGRQGAEPGGGGGDLGGDGANLSALASAL